MSDDAKSIIEAQEKLAERRQNWSNWWQQIALRVMPSEAQFTVLNEEGQRRQERVFSGKPVTANEKFAAIMDDLLTPRSQIWHTLAPEDDDLADSQESKVYLERLNTLVFTQRYRPAANFASQKSQGYLQVGAFGNSALFIDEEVGKGLRYHNIPLREVFWSTNHQGQIDVLYRRFFLDARQAAQRAKVSNWQLPTRITDAATKDPFKKFEFIHCVRPNDDRVYGRIDAKGMPYASYYLALEDKFMCSSGGFTSWPYGIGRYMLAPNEVFARSPAMSCWGAILTINEEKKTILRAGQKEVDPPLLLAEDGILEAMNMRPGALNHGALSAQGEELVKPLKLGANIPLGMELLDLEGKDIEDAFSTAIYQVLLDHPDMTATQVLEIAQQKGMLLAPMMGRQQSEDLGPLILREIDLLSRDSRFNWIATDMPDELRERGGAFKIEYRSSLARMLRAQDGVAIMRTFEAIPAAMQIDPDAALVFDVIAGLRELSEINGVPAKLLRDDKTIQAMQAQKQQQQALQSAVAAAPAVSQAALNAAKADQARAAV
ncbi:MAG: portal protein [Pseudomonadota bacterium]